MTRKSPKSGTAFIFAVSVVVAWGVSSCTRAQSETVAPEPAPEEALPALATIGGAQDVWPFDFGFDSGRAGVRAVLGEPVSAQSRPAGTGDSQAVVETWTYAGESFTFFVDDENSMDQLLSATVTGPEAALRGGLAIGMEMSEALELLGEPGHRDGNRFIYFYYTTTIEIVDSGGIVSEVVLSLAMP